jgi:hypothetical protein
VRLTGWSSPRARNWQRRGRMAYRATSLAGPIVGSSLPSRLWAAAFFWALAIPFIYEGYAIVFRDDPTISRIMSYQLTAHGWYFGLPIAFVLGAICLLLIGHFAGLIAIWQP